MGVVLWVVQVLLAAAYLFAGSMKAMRPIEQLAATMPWAAAIPTRVVRFIGVAEFLGGLGLLLPALTGVQPWLTVAAAAGLVLVQVLAAGFHLSRGEGKALPVNLVLLVLAALVVYGRSALVPLA